MPAEKRRRTYNGFIVKVIVPLMCLFEFLQLIHARRDGNVVLSRVVGVGNRLPISIDVVNVVVGHILFNHRVVSRPPSERFSDVERHNGVAKV